MGAKRPEPAPPKFQPVMMDEQGNYYKENPEYTKKMAKLRSHPFTMMGAAKNPSKFKKDGMPDQYIAISGDLKLPLSEKPLSLPEAYQIQCSP